jgi:hypothetical protein
MVPEREKENDSMATRREFLKSSAIAATGAMISPERISAIPAEPAPEVEGKVPDTLDLAEHGGLAIQGMMGSLDPSLDYESVFLNILDVHPAYMLHWSTMVSGVMPKFIEALPMLRTMSGSHEAMDMQDGFIAAMVKNSAEDGLVYDRALGTRPWNVGVYYGRPDWNEDYASMAGNGRMLAGLTFWHQMTGDDIWKERAKKTAERLLELAVEDGDRAWYPNPGCGNDFSYPRVSGWTTKDPPASLNEGYEHFAVHFSLTQHLRGFSRYYQMTGDERFLRVSKKFVNFVSQPKFWGDVHDTGKPSAFERGHFRGHFHASLGALRALLDHAVGSNDEALKLTVRDGYEYGRQMGIHRLGIFPNNYEMTEGCTIGDMVGLAVALCDAGLGDYWDDVEMYARNGLPAAQATDGDELRRVSEEGKDRPPKSNWGGRFDTRFSGNNKGNLPGQEINDRVLERTVGSFGHLLGARYLIPQMMSCCTANCSMGLYYAWEGILRSDGHSAAVNMWLNRRSPWLDVWSSLPYEGRLEIQNKGLRRISLRKPSWTRPSEITCRIDGHEANPEWSGNRMVFDQLAGNERIDIAAELAAESRTYTLLNLNTPDASKEEYRCEFRGHTSTSVVRTVLGQGPDDPYFGDLNWYRIFRSDSPGEASIPQKTIPSYVLPERIVKWTLT